MGAPLGLRLLLALQVMPRTRRPSMQNLTRTQTCVHTLGPDPRGSLDPRPPRWPGRLIMLCFSRRDHNTRAKPGPRFPADNHDM